MKPITTQERWGTVLLLEETRQRWVGQQCEVLTVGELEYCEDLETCDHYKHVLRENLKHSTADVVTVDVFHPCEVQAGDWLLCRPRCFVATDEPNVWVCKQSDVLARLTLEAR